MKPHMPTTSTVTNPARPAVRMHYRATVRCDLYRYYARIDFPTFLRAWFRMPAFKFTLWLRTTAHLRSRGSILMKPAYILSRMMLEHYSVKYGYQIPFDTEVGAGLYLSHVGPIIVNPLAKIGRNVNIAVGVTIGQTNRGKRAGVPTIGDRVWIGTNAVVVGSVSIGDGALIGPGAYVNFDVPPNGVVIGNPGKIVSDSGTAGYVENTLD